MNMKSIPLTLLLGCLALAAQAVPNGSDNLKAACMSADFNHEGFVSLDEFHQDVLNGWRALPVDTDGYVPIADLVAIPGMGRGIVERLKSADTDGDGKVSFKEVVTARMAASSSGPPALPKPMHLVLGESGAACVQAACDVHGMPGTVLGLTEDLAYGPLDETKARAIERARAHAVVLWSGGNVGDAVFVAMACEQLAGRPEPLFRFEVPQGFVAMLSPQRLAQLYASRKRMSTSQRQAQALDFARMRDSCGPLRRLELGRVVGAPIDSYDPLLLAACAPDWQTLGQVVGAAMGQCDSANLVGDLFFRERLDTLIDRGRLVFKGVRGSLREGFVRNVPVSTLPTVPA